MPTKTPSLLLFFPAKPRALRKAQEHRQRPPRAMSATDTPRVDLRALRRLALTLPDVG